MVSVRLDKRSMVASTCSNQACYMCLLINICVLPFLPTSYQLLPQHNAVELQTRYFFYYYYLNKKNQYTTISFLFFSFFFSFFFFFFNFCKGQIAGSVTNYDKMKERVIENGLFWGPEELLIIFNKTE